MFNNLISLVTYNTQFCTGLDGQTDINRIISEIKTADIICLQEIDRYWKRSGMIDQAKIIASLIPKYYWAFGPGIDVDSSMVSDDGQAVNRRRQHGNMILSRWPLLAVRNHLLPKMELGKPFSSQRAALEVIIDLFGKACRVYSVHLAHASAKEREKQILQLLSIIDHSHHDGRAWSGTDIPKEWATEGPELPLTRSIVVAGDFNLTPDSNEYIELCRPMHFKYDPPSTKNRLSDGWLITGNDRSSGHTMINHNPLRRLDYILVNNDVADQVETMWVNDQATGSDHKPLWAKIRWP